MRSTRLVWSIAAAAALLALAWWFWRPRAEIVEAAARPPQASPPVPAAPTEPAPQPAAPEEEVTGPEDLGGTWENVDLEAIRREMPDNLYFTLAIPTEDPKVLEARGELRVNLVVDRAGDQDSAGLCQRLQPRRDVDCVAEHAGLLLDHVAEGDADAQLHLPLARQSGDPGRDALLYR